MVEIVDGSLWKQLRRSDSPLLQHVLTRTRTNCIVEWKRVGVLNLSLKDELSMWVVVVVVVVQKLFLIVVTVYCSQEEGELMSQVQRDPAATECLYR